MRPMRRIKYESPPRDGRMDDLTNPAFIYVTLGVQAA